MPRRLLLLVFLLGMSVCRDVRAQTNAPSSGMDDAGQIKVKEEEKGPVSYYQQLLDERKNNTDEYLKKKQAENKLDQQKKNRERADKLREATLRLREQEEEERKKEVNERQIREDLKEQMLAKYLKQLRAQGKQKPQTPGDSLQKAALPVPKPATPTEQSSKLKKDREMLQPEGAQGDSPVH